MTSVELYFIPTSFYSQRVRLSLKEKGIQHKETYVSLFDNEQGQPWYLKLNPNGEVPVLKVGDQCYYESEKIVDIVDALPSAVQGKLVPNPDSPEGKQVAYWRQRIDGIEIPILTFGVSVFPEFATTKLCGGLITNAEGVRARFEQSLRRAEEMKLKHPELKDMYDRKIALAKQRLIDFFDKERVSGVLKSTDAVMAEIENQLSNVARVGGLMRGVEYFLCGKTFTAADVNLCILLGRFRMVGVLHRFADPVKYPNVDKYWQQVQKRNSVQKVVINNVAETKAYMIRQKIRRYAGVAAIVGVAGVAVWFAYKHLRK